MRTEQMKHLNYLIIGGDDRFIELVRILKKEGYKIATYGLEKADIKDVRSFNNLEDALISCDVCIGPIPFSKDVTKINTKYAQSDIEIEELLSHIPKDKILLVGAMNNYSKKLAEKYEVKYTDYYTDESYQILNTIPTCEGTIAIMVNETGTTIYKSKVMILGYGRIGKLLSEYLSALGAEVYVEARKDDDLTWIAAKRMTPVHLKKLDDYIGQMDIIINTIPALILGPDRLNLVKKDSLLIDLASKPGGIDFDYAKEKGIKTIHALSIPGKIAYQSAAQYIYDTIINRVLAAIESVQ